MVGVDKLKEVTYAVGYELELLNHELWRTNALPAVVLQKT